MRRSKQLEELRERNSDQLEEELKETRTRLFQDRIRFATRNLDNPSPLHAGKKRVARILTLMRERDLAEGAPRKRKAKKK